MKNKSINVRRCKIHGWLNFKWYILRYRCVRVILERDLWCLLNNFSRRLFMNNDIGQCRLPLQRRVGRDRNRNVSHNMSDSTMHSPEYYAPDHRTQVSGGVHRDRRAFRFPRGNFRATNSCRFHIAEPPSPSLPAFPTHRVECNIRRMASEITPFDVHASVLRLILKREPWNTCGKNAPLAPIAV